MTTLNAHGSRHPERRRQPRVRGPLAGTWRGEFSQVSGIVWDISAIGCFVECPNHDLRQGHRVHVTIAVDGGDIHAVGEVVHMNPRHGFALEFVEVPKTSRRLLATALQYRTDGTSGSADTFEG